MKTKVIFLTMAMLALCRPADAKWRFDYTLYKKWLNSLSGGPGFSRDPLGPCDYADEGECLNALNKAAREAGDSYYKDKVKCKECDGSGGNSGGSSEQQLAQILGNKISDSILNLLFPKKQNISPQDEIDSQNTIKHQQEEEQKKEAARIAGNQAWIDLQNIEQGNRTFDDAKKLEAGKDLLEEIRTIDSGDLTFKTIGTDFFGTTKPSEVKLQSKGKGNHPTSDLKPAAVPDIPEPKKVDPKQVEAWKQKLTTLISGFQKNVKFLQDIEIKLNDTEVKIKEAESKKEVAQIKLEEAKNTAATAKPEEKSQDDELEKQAKAELQNADDLIAKAKQSKNDMTKEKEKMIKENEKIENEAKKLNAEIQAEGK